MHVDDKSTARKIILKGKDEEHHLRMSNLM